jgi:hypothetical protein
MTIIQPPLWPTIFFLIHILSKSMIGQAYHNTPSNFDNSLPALNPGELLQ